MKRTISTTARTEVLDIALVTALLFAACIVVPLAVLGAPKSISANAQWFVGPAVNCALVYAALRFHGRVKIATLICAPSVCALAIGIICASPFALLMAPAIWLGNAALVLTFKKCGRSTYAPLFAIAAKCSIIFGGFLLLNAFGAFPNPVAAVLFTTMGIMQVFTATIGCALAYAAVKIVPTF
jgi:hypothetical protein